MIGWTHSSSHDANPGFSYQFKPGNYSKADFSQIDGLVDLGSGSLADFLSSSGSQGSAKQSLRCANEIAWNPIQSLYESKSKDVSEVGGGSGAGFQIYCGDNANAPMIFSSGGGGGGGFSTAHPTTIGGGGGGGSSIYLPTDSVSKPWKSKSWVQFNTGGGQGCGTGNPYDINCGVRLDGNALSSGRLANDASHKLRDVIRICGDGVGVFLSGGGGGGGGGGAAAGGNHNSNFKMGYGFSFSALFCPPSSVTCKRKQKSNSMTQWSSRASARELACDAITATSKVVPESGLLDLDLWNYAYMSKSQADLACQFVHCPDDRPYCSTGVCSDKSSMPSNSDPQIVNHNSHHSHGWLDSGLWSGFADYKHSGYGSDWHEKWKGVVANMPMCQFIQCPPEVGTCQHGLCVKEPDTHSTETQTCLAFTHCPSGMSCGPTGVCQPTTYFSHYSEPRASRINSGQVTAPADSSLDEVLRAVRSQSDVQNDSPSTSGVSNDVTQQVSKFDPIQGYLFEGARKCAKGYFNSMCKFQMIKSIVKRDNAQCTKPINEVIRGSTQFQIIRQICNVQVG